MGDGGGGFFRKHPTNILAVDFRHPIFVRNSFPSIRVPAKTRIPDFLIK